MILYVGSLKRVCRQKSSKPQVVILEGNRVPFRDPLRVVVKVVSNTYMTQE